MTTGDLELRIFVGDMRWKVQPMAVVEVWRGMQYVGTLSGSALCLLVEHHLATAALTAAIQHELAESSAEPMLRRPLAPISQTQKAALRRARRPARKRMRDEQPG